MGSCHYCRNAVSAEVLRRHRLCPHCGSDLHACRNCEHYAPELATKCREPESPWVADRGAENDCSWFEFRRSARAAEPEETPTEQAKKAFEALFRRA